MANFIISSTQCVLVDSVKYLAGQESELSAAWSKMSTDKRKLSQYAHAKNQAVVFKVAPPNPATGEVDYQAPSYNPVTINVVIPVPEEPTQPAPQPSQPQEPTEPTEPTEVPLAGTTADDGGEVI